MKLLQTTAPAGSMKERVRAFAIHLGISLVIATIAAFIVFGLWFPQPYGEMVGGTRIFMLLMIIDVILGPCCTFVVFNRHKSGLKFDLAVIAALQLSALAYGMHVAANSRIVFLVLGEDMLYVTPATSIEPTDLAKAAKSEFAVLSWSGPKLVSAPNPTNPDDQFFLATSGARGKDINGYPKFFEDYSTNAKRIAQEAKPVDALLAGPKAPLLTRALSELGLAPQDVGFVPVRGKNPDADKTALLERSTGKLVAVLEIDPWL